MSSFKDIIIRSLQESGLSSIEDLFDACLRLCEKFAEELGPCMAWCHNRFNIARVFTVEAS